MSAEVTPGVDREIERLRGLLGEPKRSVHFDAMVSRRIAALRRCCGQTDPDGVTWCEREAGHAGRHWNMTPPAKVRTW